MACVKMCQLLPESWLGAHPEPPRPAVVSSYSSLDVKLLRVKPRVARSWREAETNAALSECSLLLALGILAFPEEKTTES